MYSSIRLPTPISVKPTTSRAFLVVANNDTVAHIYTHRRLRLAETNVKRVCIPVVLPIQRDIFLVK